MTTATIEKGSKVRIEFEAEYDKFGPTTKEHLVKGEEGKVYYAPKDAKIEVVQPPLPPEPSLGSIVKDSFGCCTFKRYSGGWYRLRDDAGAFPGAKAARTWREVVIDLGGAAFVRYLVEKPVSNPNATNLKDDELRLTNRLNNVAVTVKWTKEAYIGERIKFRVDGNEVFRLDPEDADKLVAAIRKTRDN